MAEPTQTFGPWLKQKLVEAGEIAPDAQGVNLDPKVRDAYLRMWQNESKGGSNFQPSIVTVTNPTTQAAEQAFMSSPNSAQLMRDTQPRVQYKPDKEGNLLAIEGTLANYVTNNTGERIKIDPKSNALADALAAMAGPQGAAPAESGGFLSGLFGGGAPVTNAPTPMPAATPAATPMATPMPAMAGTNAPVPALSTPEAVRAAFLAGQISEAQAVQMLRGGR
jgi:hypothetical protein